MSQLKDKKILVIGAGPRAIGQSGECDQGAVEACRMLSEAGCRIIVLNPNPDTLITDGAFAHQTYLEPLNLETLEQILALEKPDALLPLFGGRSALHLTVQLSQKGLMTKYKTALWGTSAESLNCVLDRDALNDALAHINLRTPPIFPVSNVDGAVAKAQELGYPVVLRSDDPHLIADGILAYNQEELGTKASHLAAEQKLNLSVEAALWQWHQVSLEILRDNQGKSVLAGALEYMDASSIHPGDTVGVSPPQSISGEFIEKLFRFAQAIADHLKIVGSATIRFAHHPIDLSVLVLAVHPRYTRTTSLVSRTSGLPLACIASHLAAGCQWPQLPSEFPPPPYYPSASATIGVKWPIWDFERLTVGEDRLGPQMQAVGQAIGLGSTFKEAFQKAARCVHPHAHNLGQNSEFTNKPLTELMTMLATPNSKRPYIIFEALRQGASIESISQCTHIRSWFIQQLQQLVEVQAQLLSYGQSSLPDSLLRQAKRDGFSDDYLSHALNIPRPELFNRLIQLDLRRRWHPAGHAQNALFSTYHASGFTPRSLRDPKVLILGSGAHRIGQGAEFDHAVFHAATAAENQGYTPITLDCNLAGAATGIAMPGRSYCDPVNAEEVLAVIQSERPVGIITQFAGPKTFEMIRALNSSNVEVMGTPFETLQLLRNRPAFRQRMRELGIPQPAAVLAYSVDEVKKKAMDMEWCIIVQPREKEACPGTDHQTELIVGQAKLERYLGDIRIDQQHPLFVEQYLEYAIEAQVQALCDGRSTFIAAVLEHIELAGVHAADSACVLPPYSIAPRHLETMAEYTRKIGEALRIKGLLHVRFAIYRDTVYLLDAGCGASYHLTFVSKTTQLPLPELAVQLILGQRLEDLNLSPPNISFCGVRAAVFPFNVFTEVDPLLGPHMRATGQVLNLAESFGMAYFKALQAAGTPLPTEGTVLITVTDEDKPSILEPARIFQEMGFKIMATRGTQAALAEHGIQAELVRKLGFGRPHLVDEIKNGHVQMVINTPSGGQSQRDDSFIRKAAIRYRIANITTPASAIAAAKGIAARRRDMAKVRSMQSFCVNP